MDPDKKTSIQELLKTGGKVPQRAFSFKLLFSLAGLTLFCCLLSGGFYYWRTFEAAELHALDWHFRHWNYLVRKIPIVHVDIDQASLSQIGKWPFSRTIHAEVATQLKKAGAKWVLFDILFEEESTAEADRALAESIQKAGNLFLSVSMEVPKREAGEKWKPYLEPIQVHRPLPAFEAAAIGTGFVDVVPDLDGGMRRVPLLAKDSKGRWVPHLALALALKEWGADINSVKIEQGRLLFQNTNGEPVKIPVDPRGFLMINWAGKWQTSFPHFSYAELLDQDWAGDRDLEGAICFVGFTAPGAVDAFPTPVGPLTPGVAGLVHATNTLLTQQWVTRSTPAKNLLAVFALIFFVFLCYSLQIPWLGLTGTAAAAVLYPVAAVGAFYFNRVWIDLVLPLSSVLISSLVFEGFNYVRAHREKLLNLFKFLKLQSYTEHVVESIAGGLITVDTQGCVVKMNANARRLLGANGSFEGKRFEEVAALQPIESVLRRALKSEGGSIIEELELKREGGTPTLLLVRTSRLRDASGEWLGAVALLDDVTRQRTLEEKLQQSRRLASLGELAAGVVHEVKNPLSAIRGFAELLGQIIPQNPKAQEYKTIIVHEADRLNDFVMDFLKFARPEKPKWTANQIHGIIQDTLLLCDPIFKKNRVQADLEFEKNMPQSLMDPNHLKQVLLNLIQNAAQAMENGGKIRIRTAFEKLSEEEKGLLEKQFGEALSGADGMFLKIDVIDEGPGFPEQIREHLFEPFFTTKKGGTGLGLAISHKMIEVEKGLLELVRDTEKGTHFKIVIPYRRAEAGEKAA